MKRWNLLLPAAVLTLLALAGCQTTPARPEEKLTVGKVQKEIRVGMSGAEVVQALGSPNLVSTDEARREVWVYDKIATERVTSDSAARVWFLWPLGYGASSTSTTQRTLTIIIKFDEQGKVRDLAYHTSRF